MKENYLAIALGKVDVGETDRMYTFYTREEGLMRVGAKGVRKAHAKLAPHVEDFVLTQITIAKNYGPGTLAGAITEHAHTALRQDFDTLTTLSRVRDVFVNVVRGVEKDEKVFELFENFLHHGDAHVTVKHTTHIGFLADGFLFQLFDLLGYGFDLYNCASCGMKLGEDRHFFGAELGGVVCKICAQKEVYVVPLDVQTITFLRLVRKNDIAHICKVVVTERVERQLHAVTKHISTWIMR